MSNHSVLRQEQIRALGSCKRHACKQNELTHDTTERNALQKRGLSVEEKGRFRYRLSIGKDVRYIYFWGRLYGGKGCRHRRCLHARTHGHASVGGSMVKPRTWQAGIDPPRVHIVAPHVAAGPVPIHRRCCNSFPACSDDSCNPPIIETSVNVFV